MTKKWPDLASIRREYGELTLNREDIAENPMEQFQRWFDEVLQVEKSDPTAMVLSTVDADHRPDARVVLLKGVYCDHFVFYTNYLSTKSQQLKAQPHAALTFFWPQMVRQIRVRGSVKKLEEERSDEYFQSRPLMSQLSALASPQSQEVASREELEQRLNQLIEEYGQEPVLRPQHWGGFALQAETIEFWQGRDNRMHDRILYKKENGEVWTILRLAP